MKRSMLLTVALVSCAQQQKKPWGCDVPKYEEVQKANLTSAEAQNNLLQCWTYNAIRLAKGPDSAGETASAAAGSCEAHMQQFANLLQKEGDQTTTLEDIRRDVRGAALGEIVEYRARGCPRISTTP